MRIPTWMRTAMVATALMNVAGAVTFLPTAEALRRVSGLPNDGHPFYMATVGAFVLIFGVAYLWIGFSGRADPLFVAVAAAGKLTFFGLLVGFWLAGHLPGAAPMSGVGDLVFGVLFVAWLYTSGRTRDDA